MLEQLGAQELDGDTGADRGVLGQEHAPHGAVSQQGHQLVADADDVAELLLLGIQNLREGVRLGIDPRSGQDRADHRHADLIQREQKRRIRPRFILAAGSPSGKAQRTCCNHCMRANRKACAPLPTPQTDTHIWPENNADLTSTGTTSGCTIKTGLASERVAGGVMKRLALILGMLLVACGGDANSGNGGDGGKGGGDGGKIGDGGLIGPHYYIDDAGNVVYTLTDDAGNIIGPTCGAQTEPIATTKVVTPPDILIVLDKSGSMSMSVAGATAGATRWSAISAAIQTRDGGAAGQREVRPRDVPDRQQLRCGTADRGDQPQQRRGHRGGADGRGAGRQDPDAGRADRRLDLLQRPHPDQSGRPLRAARDRRRAQLRRRRRQHDQPSRWPPSPRSTMPASRPSSSAWSATSRRSATRS